MHVGSGYKVDPFALMAGAGVIGVILMIAAFVASIVIFVKFAQTEEDLVKKNGWSWRHFLCFDRLVLSGILKYLYILSALEIIACGLMLWFSVASLGVGEFFLGFLFALVFIVFSELLCRVSFEFMMLMVKVTENTADIKKAVCSSSGAGAAPQSSGQAGGAAPVVAAAPSAPAAPVVLTCPVCGRQSSKGAFCAGCGTPLPR